MGPWHPGSARPPAPPAGDGLALAHHTGGPERACLTGEPAVSATERGRRRYTGRVRVLAVRSVRRPFEEERFGAAWERAGGRPEELVWVTPATPEEAVRAALAGAGGLLLSGGPDVEPWRYGAVPEPGVTLETDPARDELDLRLLAAARERGLPVLAVCYGCQLLAVAHGGRLIQDLERAGLPGHADDGRPRHLPRHPVRRSREAVHLAWLPEELEVNSRHHQGIADPGDLRVAARAPDGVIEAVEGGEPGRPVIGVQWHPEDLDDTWSRELFARFRLACGPG